MAGANAASKPSLQTSQSSASNSKSNGDPQSPFSFAASAAQIPDSKPAAGSGEVSPAEATDEITPMFSSQSGSDEIRRNYNTTDNTTTARPSLAHSAPNDAGTNTANGGSNENGQGQHQGSIAQLKQRRATRKPNQRAMGGGDGAGDRAEGDEADGETGEAKQWGTWWSTMLDKYGSVELDNKGATARDHLALERTFLAWLRTSLAFASIGIAITQLFRLNTTITDREGAVPVASDGEIRLRQIGKPLGATFLGIAIVVLLTGGRRYFEGQYWIIRGKFPASRGSVVLVTAVAACLIIVSLVVVVSVSPTQFVNGSEAAAASAVASAAAAAGGLLKQDGGFVGEAGGASGIE